MQKLGVCVGHEQGGGSPPLDFGRGVGGGGHLISTCDSTRHRGSCDDHEKSFVRFSEDESKHPPSISDLFRFAIAKDSDYILGSSELAVSVRIL